MFNSTVAQKTIFLTDRVFLSVRKDVMLPYLRLTWFRPVSHFGFKHELESKHNTKTSNDYNILFGVTFHKHRSTISPILPLIRINDQPHHTPPLSGTQEASPVQCGFAASVIVQYSRGKIT